MKRCALFDISSQQLEFTDGVLYNNRQIYIELINLPGDCVKKRYYPFCRVVAIAAVEWMIALYVFWEGAA